MIWLWVIDLIFQKRHSYYTAPVGHNHTHVPCPYKKQNDHQKENVYQGVFQEANFREAVDQSSAAGWSPYLSLPSTSHLFGRSIYSSVSSSVFLGTKKPVRCSLKKKKCAAKICEMLLSIILCKKVTIQINILSTLKPRLFQVI